MIPTELPLIAIPGSSPISQHAMLTSDVDRFALAYPGLFEGQADDRTPMNGSVADSGETAPGQRAFARQTHQLMFKKWSQARRD